MVTVTNLAAQGGGVSFNAGNVVTQFAGVVSGNASFIFVGANAAAALTVGFVDGVNGITTANGQVTILNPGAGGLLTVSNAINTGNADVSLTADAMAINAAINAGTQNTVKLFTILPGRNIDLGTKSTCNLGLTDTELDRVSAGTLSIGTPSPGNI